jgi:hypothetical protein
MAELLGAPMACVTEFNMWAEQTWQEALCAALGNTLEAPPSLVRTLLPSYCTRVLAFWEFGTKHGPREAARSIEAQTALMCTSIRDRAQR